MSCFVCKKHKSLESAHTLQLKGVEHFIVAHSPDMSGNDDVYLGGLIVEPKRHVQNWSELSDEESVELASIIRELNRVLYSHNQIEHVYIWVFGDAVEHMHVWIMPRYIDTPRKYWGTRVTEWPDARKGSSAQVSEIMREFQALAT